MSGIPWMTGQQPAQPTMEAPPIQQPPPMPSPYGYGMTPPPQAPPQYNLQQNAQVTGSHPQYPDIRRFRFTGKQLFGGIFAIITLTFFLSGIFWALLFIKFIDAINGALDGLDATLPVYEAINLILCSV